MSDDVSEDFSEIDVSSADVESGGGGSANYKNVPLLNYYQMTGLALQQLGLIIGIKYLYTLINTENTAKDIQLMI